jgi:hypothetical protein
MADFKRRTLVLSSGKQLKLYGSSIAIGKSLEIGEGYAPNIFSLGNDNKLYNPHQLNADELMDMADYAIQLWMDLKNNVRKHGVESSKLFNAEGIR